jgi:hypothetical protein
MIFDDIPRSDARPARQSERRSDFLNRSASVYFVEVRRVMEEWFSHLPSSSRDDLRGRLRGEDREADAAFWELYLHEAYRQSGFEIEIHPELPGRTRHPDFRMSRNGESWYLEAVSVGLRPDLVARDRRIRGVYQVLEDMRVKDFSLEVTDYAIGNSQLATKKMRLAVMEWLARLDPDVVAEQYCASSAIGFARLPELRWKDADWHLEFHAIPMGEWARGVGRSALGMLGPGRAVVVDNVSGLRRVLASKRSKYGRLDAPLVIAILSSTEIPTRNYEVDQALYGVSPHRPSDALQHPESFLEDGLWLTKQGWTRGHIPQVITTYDLKPWNVTREQPLLWSTLQPDVAMPVQPSWLAPVQIGLESIPGRASSLASHFGLPDQWCAGDPDFTER